jgi:eukaryotic-like serine/threonine-protein kinase
VNGESAPPRTAGAEALLRGHPYRLIRRLGGGGMSAVYLVEHELLLRSFALKILHPFHARREDLADRARLEAQAIAKLCHPNVVEVVDFWFGADGSPCIVLEHLEGHTLARELEQSGTLDAAEAVSYARQALSALSAAHAIGVVHRDIKPDNLFLHEVTGRGRVLKVLDFGLARVLPDAQAAAPEPLHVPTNTGVVMGSLRFMSPEAQRGERVGPAADLYSVGLVLYWMLTGGLPADPKAPEPPSRRRDLAAHPDLEAALLQAIRWDPAERFANAAAFRRALKNALRAPSSG